MTCFRVLLVVILFLSCRSARTVNASDDLIDYATKIQPILSENCFLCHGPDEGSREAGLRLDVPSEALTTSSIIVPGDAEGSSILDRVTSMDPDLVMPPPDHGKSLSQAEIDLLRRWIQQGAKYSQHWAFTTPTKAAIYAEGENPIDAIVVDRLARDGLLLSARASAESLCRRIYLDIVGLPPTIDQLHSFVTQSALSPEQAVETLVESLLSETTYGEKWARHWLDVARYSDTNGFEKDLPREQWAWRDWVIESINEDKSYDQFILEQIAGDLLPNATQEQFIATGFLRNGMVNEEGAIIPEQFRIEGNFDRMDCIGRAILGLTFQCAQCHSHKFDPISQDDYYGMFAFINDTHESQQLVYTLEQKAKIDSLKHEIAQIEDAIKAKIPDWQQELQGWSKSYVDSLPKKTEVLVFEEPVLEGGLNHPISLHDHSILTLGHPTTHAVVTLVAKSRQRVIQEVLLEALLHGDLPFGGPGRSYRGTFAISEFTLSYKSPGDADWKPIAIKTASADFEEPDHELEEYFFSAGHDNDKRRRVGPASFLIDNDQKTAWRADRGPMLRNTESAVAFTLAEPLTLPDDSELRIQLHMNHGGDGNGRDNLLLGRLRLSVMEGNFPKPLINHAAAIALQTDALKLTSREQTALFRAWASTRPELSDENAHITRLEKSYPEAITSVLSIAETPTEFDRSTFVFERGEWNKPTRPASTRVPDVLHDLDHSSDSVTRLDFAKWLTDRRSPLTARVQVNRVWQAIFGKGLVETSEDFGTRAPIPRYQELLDWLAVDFMEHQWSQKHLLKTILTSKVYAQSSVVTPEAYARDPYNDLLARGPRFRLEAEVIRDIALSISGLLHSKVGGPSVFPPVPQSVLDDNYFKLDYWSEAQGPDRYRRSLYVFRKRAMPDPVLTSFDSPNSDIACTRRVRSNTPLAALVSLNEPVFVEAARAMALRIAKEGGNTDDSRIDYAYRLCVARSATTAEKSAIMKTLDEQRTRLSDGWLSIREVAFGDTDSLPKLPEGVTPRDIAAWTIVSRVLLNLDETLSKN